MASPVRLCRSRVLHACADFVQGWAQSLGLFFGLGSAFIAVHGLANVMIFMTTYRYDIKFCAPHFLRKQQMTRAFLSLMGGQIVSGLSEEQEDS